MGDFPSLVSIRSEITRRHFCCGTIIDELHILTAAHCLFTNSKGPRLPIDFEAVAGALSIDENVLTDTRVVLRPALIFIHPQYDESTYFNDIAILRLINAIEFVENVTVAAELPEKGVDEETMCSVAGWGYMSEHVEQMVNDQRKVDLPIVKDSFCRHSYGKLFRNDLKFCAGYLAGRRSPCFGDSGSGLICNEEVHGIVTFGKGCARSYYPALFTNVTSYRNWIGSCFTFNETQNEIPMPQRKLNSTTSVASKFQAIVKSSFICLRIFVFILIYRHPN